MNGIDDRLDFLSIFQLLSRVSKLSVLHGSKHHLYVNLLDSRLGTKLFVSEQGGLERLIYEYNGACMPTWL